MSDSIGSSSDYSDGSSAGSNGDDSTGPMHYPLNTDYGTGVFRRRIRLQGLPGKVVAELEDCCHGFRSVVYHDGKKVTDVQAEALRIPHSTCGGAVAPIKAMIGMPLATAAKNINREVNPRANCTHLYDLTVLAVAHCLRGETERLYDVAIDDEPDEQAVSASVSRDGKTVLNWQTHQWIIQEPAALAGKPLYKGFAAWANQAFDGDEQEAAFVLQKGYFVSIARRFDSDKMAGAAAANDESMIGVCYTYSPDVVAGAFRMDHSTRDFTDTPEQLLKFL